MGRDRLLCRSRDPDGGRAILETLSPVAADRRVATCNPDASADSTLITQALADELAAQTERRRAAY